MYIAPIGWNNPMDRCKVIHLPEESRIVFHYHPMSLEGELATGIILNESDCRKLLHEWPQIKVYGCIRTECTTQFTTGHGTLTDDPLIGNVPVPKGL
jgi:hypothetical protein